MGTADQDALLTEKIKKHQDRCHQTYGYRRMYLWLAHQGIHRNPKTVLETMKKYGILSEIRRKRKWQNLITPSMSRNGNPYDNAMAKNFFSILKTECIYRRKPRTLSDAQRIIDNYIHFYNNECIQTKTGVAPLTLRQSA